MPSLLEKNVPLLEYQVSPPSPSTRLLVVLSSCRHLSSSECCILVSKRVPLHPSSSVRSRFALLASCHERTTVLLCGQKHEQVREDTKIRTNKKTRPIESEPVSHFVALPAKVAQTRLNPNTALRPGALGCMEDVHLGVKRKGSTSWLFPKEVSSAATYELVSEYGREICPPFQLEPLPASRSSAEYTCLRW